MRRKKGVDGGKRREHNIYLIETTAAMNHLQHFADRINMRWIYRLYHSHLLRCKQHTNSRSEFSTILDIYLIMNTIKILFYYHACMILGCRCDPINWRTHTSVNTRIFRFTLSIHNLTRRWTLSIGKLHRCSNVPQSGRLSEQSETHHMMWDVRDLSKQLDRGVACQ